MTFFAPCQWDLFSRRSHRRERIGSERFKVRARPKHADESGRAGVLERLESRELIGSFVADVAVTAHGVAAAERLYGPFDETSWLVLPVPGASSSETSPTTIDRGSSQSIAPQTGTIASSSRGEFSSDGASLTDEPRVSFTESPSAATDIADESLPPVIGDGLPDLVPRPHGTIRKLQLAPPTAVVGARTTFVAEAGASTSDGRTSIEVPSIDEPARFSAPVANSPPLLLTVQPPSSGDQTAPLGPIGPSSPEPGGSGTQSAEGSSSQIGFSEHAATGTEGRPGEPGSETSSTDVAAGSALESSAGPVFGPTGKSCSGGGPAGMGQSGGGIGQSGGGPPCTPPGQQSSSVADPLFVLNWNDGLVMFPGVYEYDTPGQSVDLRAQVYGATVQSYSWNLSQAPEAGCVTGQNNYRLQFTWASNPYQEDKTETITVTATMTDQTTMSQTLTFKLGQLQTSPCGSGGGGGGSPPAWPAVLTPDKPAEPQNLLATDSATRPYAVSLETGGLFVTHDLPTYNPGAPPLNLTYSSLAAERRPIFINRYELNPAAAVPNTVSARLQFNGSWGPSKFYDTSPATTKYNPGDILQISLQADAGSLATGRYSYTFETTANYTGSSTTTTNTGTVTIINEEASPFGEGWTLDVLDRLHVATGGVILNEGAGNSLWFASNGGSGGGTFTTPPGDFSTLVQNMGGTYTRTLKDGVKQNFNAAGLQTSIVDRNNNTVSFAYIDADLDGQVDELTTITDANGLVTTLAYLGTCGAGVSPARVCTITDPSGRVTNLQYNSAGKVLSVTDPDGAVWQFTPDTASGRIASMKDPRNNTTDFSYDFAGRVATVTRPDTTTEQFKALQLQSLCDAGQCTQGNPGLPLLAAEAVGEHTDPRGNAWDYRLDWFGFGVSTQVTDPLGQSAPGGHMAVFHRDSNGLVSQDTDRLGRDSRYVRDPKGNPTTITRPDRTTQQYQYNSFSQPIRRTDELGRQTDYAYDIKGNLTQVTEPDPDGAGPLTSPITTLAYDSQGNLTSTTDPRGKVTTVTVDSRDRPTLIKYPDDDADPNNDPTVSFVYDTASNVTSRTNERGYATTLTFDALGRPLSETDPLNHTTSYLFDAAGNLTRVTNALNQSTDFGHSTMNRRVTVTDALGNATNVTYDNDGNIVQVKDPINRTTARGFNQLSQHTSTTTPLSSTTNYGRDVEGQRTSVTDPLNNTATAAYNNRGWTTTSTSPLNNSVSSGYDLVGNMTSQSQSGGGQSFQFDGLDRTTQFTNEVNANTAFAYDPAGNMTSSTDPLNHADSLAYDARNRPINFTNALNNSIAYLYDGVGNLTRVTDPLNRAANFGYDPADRLTSIAQPDPDGGGPLGTPITSFGYDDADRLASLTDPVNNLTSWTIDAAGRVTGEVDPLGNSRSYIYNGAGELTRVTDRAGRVRDFVYDADGRRTQELWCGVGVPPAYPCSSPIRTIAYTYNADNQLTAVSDPDFSYTFTYDADGRLATINNAGTPNIPQVTLTNTYDGDDNRTNLADSLGGSVAFGFDGARRMTSAAMTVSGQPGPQATFTFDAADRVTLISRRLGTLDKTDTTLDYDDADRLTGITHAFVPSAGGSTTLGTYSFSFNAADELVSQTNSDGTLNYTYDQTGQLTAVSGAATESYSYDLAGNRTMTGYTTGAGNRLTSDGTFNYSYDNEGNLLVKTQISNGQRTEFTWDYRNRLTQVQICTPGGGGTCAGGTVLTQANYVYDMFNRRIGSIVDSDGTGPLVATGRWTVYDRPGLGADPYIDFVDPDAGGPQPSTLDSRRLSADAVDTVLARFTAAGAVSWLLTDHLGSVRDVTNNTASVVGHINYDGFGRILSESNPSAGDRFKFTGYEHDSETGLYQARARSYDPGTGRFVSRDPISFAAGDPNLYRYVGNRSTIRVDPLGMADDPPNMGDHWTLTSDDPAAYPDSCGLDYAAYMKAFAAWNTSPARYAGPGGGTGGTSTVPACEQDLAGIKAKAEEIAKAMYDKTPWYEPLNCYDYANALFNGLPKHSKCYDIYYGPGAYTDGDCGVVLVPQNPQGQWYYCHVVAGDVLLPTFDTTPPSTYPCPYIPFTAKYCQTMLYYKVRFEPIDPLEGPKDPRPIIRDRTMDEAEDQERAMESNSLRFPLP